MAELTERIPIETLKLLQKMKLEDYCKFADKKKYKVADIKEHYNQIIHYLKDHIKWTIVWYPFHSKYRRYHSWVLIWR